LSCAQVFSIALHVRIGLVGFLNHVCQLVLEEKLLLLVMFFTFDTRRLI